VISTHAKTCKEIIIRKNKGFITKFVVYFLTLNRFIISQAYKIIMNRIVVTGSSGSLGKKLMKKLEQTHYEYIGISRRIKNKKTKIVNLEDFNQVRDFFQIYKPKTIIHLSALTGNLECEQKPYQAFLSNVLVTYNVLKASAPFRSKIIFASTREVYGNCKNASEKSPLQPININGTTKMLAEKLIINHNKQFLTPYIILRFTNFYGENYFKRGVVSMIKKSIEGEKIDVFGGKQSLDLIHYNDVVTAIMKSINHKKTEIFNVGGGQLTTPLKLIKKIETITGKNIQYKIRPYRNFEVKSFSINLTKSKKILKFNPTIKIESFLENMVKNAQI